MAEKPGFATWWTIIGTTYRESVTIRELCASAFAAGHGTAVKRAEGEVCPTCGALPCDQTS